MLNHVKSNDFDDRTSVNIMHDLLWDICELFQTTHNTNEVKDNFYYCN